MSTLWSLILSCINWIASKFKKNKSEERFETPDVTWVKTSREDRRNYTRYCKRAGFTNLSGLPEYITAQAHDALKRRGIIK